MVHKTFLSSLPGKTRAIIFSLLISSLVLAGCGKKDEAPKTEDKPKTENKTENQSSGKKKEIKKSEQPKQDVTKEAPEDWTALATSDGKVTFYLPSQWTVTENSTNRFATLSEDQTMGTTLVIFPNDKISSDDLLEAALGDFDYEPDGEANEIQVGNIEGYITAARGNINGQDMMMYVMSAIEADGAGNYVIYIYTPTDQFEANSQMMEDILYSIHFQ